MAFQDALLVLASKQAVTSTAAGTATFDVCGVGSGTVPPMITGVNGTTGAAVPIGFDIGAGSYSSEPHLRGGFKVPSLRNVDLTAPYMHSGRFTTLHDVVSFYNEGRGHAVPKNEKLILHWHIHEPKLTNAELDRVVDFLKTLTDESFKPQRPKNVPSGLAVPLK